MLGLRGDCGVGCHADGYCTISQARSKKRALQRVYKDEYSLRFLHRYRALVLGRVEEADVGVLAHCGDIQAYVETGAVIYRCI